jgi:hypothetical protein
MIREKLSTEANEQNHPEHGGRGENLVGSTYGCMLLSAQHKRIQDRLWHYRRLEYFIQPCDFPGGKNSIVGGLIVGSLVGAGTTDEGRCKEGRSNSGRVGTSSNAGFNAVVVLGLLSPTGLVVGALFGAGTTSDGNGSNIKRVGLFVVTLTGLAVGAILGAATVPAMGAALGIDGALGADGGLGAIGANGTLGAMGAPPDGGETGGKGAVGATLNFSQQRGIGNRPR